MDAATNKSGKRVNLGIEIGLWAVVAGAVVVVAPTFWRMLANNQAVEAEIANFQRAAVAMAACALFGVVTPLIAISAFFQVRRQMFRRAVLGIVAIAPVAIAAAVYIGLGEQSGMQCFRVVISCCVPGWLVAAPYILADWPFFDMTTRWRKS